MASRVDAAAAVWLRVAQTAALMVLVGCGSGQNDAAPRDVTGDSESRRHSASDSTLSEHDAINSPATFVARTKLRFSYRNGDEAELFAILESLGGGVAIFDFDADGRMDLFCTGGGYFDGGIAVRGRPSTLARNDGDWRFHLVAVKAEVATPHSYTHGATSADLNSDGWTDLVVTGYGGLQLFYNRGDGTFDDATERSGLNDTLWSSSAAAGDVNGDGILDLYVAHYVDWSLENNPVCRAPGGRRDICPPREFRGLTDTLYLGNGDGTFRDASLEAGLRPEGKGLGVLMTDLDLDGDLDIYVTNDTVDNFLYENDGRARFTEIGAGSGTAFNDRGRPDGSMGVDAGDFNSDGLPDLWVANFEHESFALYQNEGRLSFQHVSQARGVTAATGKSVGWGTAFTDYDRDGDLDIFVSNGHVIRHPQHAPVQQRPLLFENLGERFRNVAPSAGDYFTEAHDGRGVAVGDFDDDGAPDLAISRVNAPVAILANETQGGNWIAFRLIGTTGDRNASGAIVAVESRTGRQVRQVIGGGSYASTSDPRLFFGLGDTRQVSVKVRWPHAGSDSEYELEAGQGYFLTEPASGSAKGILRAPRAALPDPAANSKSALRDPP